VDLFPQSASKSIEVNELGRRIQEVRAELGLKQIEFATLLGVSSSTMSQWESGAFAPRRIFLDHMAQVVPAA
jgi:DNA-binding transcriptional regulator YiaG